MRNGMGFTLGGLGILAFAWSVEASEPPGGRTPAQREQASDRVAIERRIIQYLEENMKPGQPVLFSHLYNEVFTEPEEREVLSRLRGAFFRVPLFLVDYRIQQGTLPTLEEIAGQFGFYGPEQADVLLAVMESDPRVPDFFRRHPESGELLELDVDRIRDDPRFNSVLERTVPWEGRVVPDVGGRSFAGPEIRLSEVDADVLLLYVWFTNCPPCVRMTPHLVALQEGYEARGFTVVGANADRVLDLSYSDDERAAYVEEHSINFRNFHLSESDRTELGNVNIFPTMFLLGRDRVIQKYYVSYQERDVLETDIAAMLDRGALRSGHCHSPRSDPRRPPWLKPVGFARRLLAVPIRTVFALSQEVTTCRL